MLQIASPICTLVSAKSQHSPGHFLGSAQCIFNFIVGKS